MRHLEGQCQHCYADLSTDGICTWEACVTNRPTDSMVLQKDVDGMFYFWGNCSPGYLGLDRYSTEREALAAAKEASYPVYYEGRRLHRGTYASL